MQTHLKSDTLTPDLAARIKRAENSKAIMEAVGLQLVSWAQGSFDDPSKRPRSWKARRSGSNPLLKKSGALVQSIRVASVSNDSVVVGTDRPYAAFHQWGTKPYVIRPTLKKALFWSGAGHPVKKVDHPGLPARPFLPFYKSGKMIPKAQERVMKTILKKLEGQA